MTDLKKSSRGARLTEVPKQPQYAPLPIEKQIGEIEPPRWGSFLFMGLFSLLLLACAHAAGMDIETLGLKIAFCDHRNAFSGPPTPSEEFPEAPSPPHIVPPEVPIPEPLLSDRARNIVLYQRYLWLNFGVGDLGDLGRMVSIVSNQFRIETSVERALLQDGWSANSILSHYAEIRGLIHSPQGSLLSQRTYSSYVSQIDGLGTRESVPYRRLMGAISRLDLLLERA